MTITDDSTTPATTSEIYIPKVQQSSSNDENQSFSPLNWTEFFETKRQVPIPAELDDDASGIIFTVYEINRDRKDLPVIVLHHGALHCALSFAAMAKELKKLVGEQARILSLDARGHGETTSRDQTNLHIDRMAKDLQNLLLTLYGPAQESIMPEIFLVGHSMGGAIVTQAAYKNLVPSLTGFAVLDILESYKAGALVHVRNICKSRPATFETLEEVIHWGVDSGTVRNVDSARVSFPGMVIRASSSGSSAYVWCANLLGSEPLWHTWFDGLTQKFLAAQAPKLLVLGGWSHIDEEMEKEHEKGKYQLSVFTESGHAVEEDDPVRAAREVVAFWKKL